MALKYEIGYVENYIGGDKIVLWFYRKRLGRWFIAHRTTMTPAQREAKLLELSNKSLLVDLGRGT